MIKSIRTKDVYEYISAITSITNVCDVFSTKPHEKATPTYAYLYFSIITNTNDVISYDTIESRIARVEVNIVCPTSFSTGQTPESVLMDIVDLLDNELMKFCDVVSLGDFTALDIVSDRCSPIFFDEKQRPYIVKDFLVSYIPNG